MRTSTFEEKHGIQWTAQNQLDGLDFGDDLALLSGTQEQMQTKTVSVAAELAKPGSHSYNSRTYGTQNNFQPISK
ncbi:unnamed protein product [Schistosoma margrebowiei]|uniref:Uncharacterized protein n=1 Tax=Schistosoma margrebowiei TaxID=48269 RepID=A0A183N800_9TREM|nr:unnamed protein product [Schistosoma margrebowiei]